MSTIRRFISDTRGTTAIEYALIATCISIVILAALTRIGQSILQKFYVQIGNGLS